MADQVALPNAESALERPTGSSHRMPAVVGVEPWSWRGDDNTGNMIHAAAARRIISKYVEYPSSGEWSSAQIDRLRSEHSHIVYVTANLIRLGMPGDHPSLKELVASHVAVAKNIEQAGLPVVVFSVGSQARLNGPHEFSVAPETVRLLKVLSDHSRKIAVRGAFTADACAKLGVNNVEVIGCQSIFWHRLPEFSWKLSEPLLDQPNKIAFNFTDALLEVKSSSMRLSARTSSHRTAKRRRGRFKGTGTRCEKRGTRQIQLGGRHGIQKRADRSATI